jgi:hypothetical protein
MIDRNQPVASPLIQDLSPSEATNKKGEATVRTIKKIMVSMVLLTLLMLMLSAVCSASAVWT